MSGLGRYDEGERASKRVSASADFCTWLHSFIRKWPRVKFKAENRDSEYQVETDLDHKASLKDTFYDMPLTVWLVAAVILSSNWCTCMRRSTAA